MDEIKVGIRKKVTFIAKRYLDYKRIIIALICLLISVGLFLSHRLILYYYPPYLNTDLNHILWKLFEVFLSLAVALFIYEKYIHKRLADLIGNTVIQSLLFDPDILKNYDFQKREEGIKNLLCAAHGTDIGLAIQEYRLQNNKLTLNNAKENYVYNIKIEPIREDTNFCKVYFHIRFETILHKGKKLLIENARAKDGFDFEKIYSRLVKQSNSIYRYILLTDTDIPISESTFVIKDFIFTCGSSESKECINFSYKYITQEEGNHLVVELVPKNKVDEKAYAKTIGKKCRIEFKIESIVDKSVRAFPIKLGYPVNNFESSLTVLSEMTNGSADIIEFINAKNEFNKFQSGRSQIIQVSGSVQGWVVPDSGLVFIW